MYIKISTGLYQNIKKISMIYAIISKQFKPVPKPLVSDSVYYSINRHVFFNSCKYLTADYCNSNIPSILASVPYVRYMCDTWGIVWCITQSGNSYHRSAWVT